MNNPYSTKSRRKTPWDQSSCRTATQEFIRTESLDHYNQKHRSLRDTNEADLLNSFELTSCRLCGSTRIKKDGFDRNGVRVYYCNECRHKFSVTTGTIFQDHKIPITEWIEYERNLFQHESLTADSWNNKNSFTTAKYWFKKTCLLLADYAEDVVVRDHVYEDETFVTVRREDLILKENGQKLRGLSPNQICIAFVTDDEGHVYGTILGSGQPSQKKIYEGLRNHIKPGSDFSHDSDTSHAKLIRELRLVSHAYNSKDLKKLDDKDNPLYQINQVHNRFQKLLRAHSGFMREDLNDYLSLFLFMENGPENKLEKVEILLNLSFQKCGILKYRQLFPHE